MTNPRSHSRQPGGFTLLELLLALAVFVALAAVLWPNLNAIPEAGRLQRVADDLRGLLNGLRVRAMDESLTYRFEYQPETGLYRVRRLGSPADSETSAAASSPAEADEPEAPADDRGIAEFDDGDPAALGERTLPTPLLFQAAAGAEESTGATGNNSAGPAATASGTAAESEAWSAVIFRPDGTASDARFWVVDGDRYVQVQVEAVTGRITISRPDFAAEATP